MIDLSVTVLSPDLVPLGLINQMTALTWTERFNDVGGFELYAPLTDDNAELLQAENLLWIGEDTLGVIETVTKEMDDEGALSLSVSGRFNECWLERRVVWEAYVATGYLSNTMRAVVNQNVINPSVTQRVLPHVTLSTSQTLLGPSTSVTVSRGDTLLTALQDLGNANGLSVRLVNDVQNRTCAFTVLSGVDRSIEQNGNPAVMLSTELSDILSSDYSMDTTAYLNTAYIGGAGEGDARRMATVNDTESGLDRRELWVDARDIQDYETWDMEKVTTYVEWDTNKSGTSYQVKITETKTLTNPDTGEKRTTVETYYEWMDSVPETKTETGTEDVTLEDSVYLPMLQERGKEKLTECLKVEAFNSQIRMQGARAYTYGEDYFLGDRITVQDKKIRVQISTEVTEVERAWDEESYTVTLTLGNAAPTITQLVRKKG